MEDLKNTWCGRFVAGVAVADVGNARSLACMHARTKLKATNNGGHSPSASLSSEAKCTIYDFPPGFLNTSQRLSRFSERPASVYFGGLIPPQSPDSRSAATAEVEPANRRWNIYGPLVLWLKDFWQQCPDRSQTKGSFWGCTQRWERQLGMPPRAAGVRPLLLNPCAFSLFQWQSSLAFALSIPSAPSSPTQDQVSLPLPCHFCNTFIVTDSWPPPRNSGGHNKVTTRSPGPG